MMERLVSWYLLIHFTFFPTDAIAVVDDFVDFGITFVESKLGPVEPIGDIYLGVVNTLCQTYLDEFNMAWAAIGFVLVFSVPMMIAACCLESVFRRRVSIAGT